MTSTLAIQERYQCAQNSSNLRVVADIRGDADYLIAAGMSKSGFGGLLRNLQSEWDGVAKPPQYGQADIERIAHSMPRVTVIKANKASLKAGTSIKKEVLDYIGAKALLKNHYKQEMRIVGLRLRSFVSVRDALRKQAVIWGHEYATASDIAHDVLMWWLAPTCGHCHGVKFEEIHGTGRLSAKACKNCNGSGQEQCPHGDAGRRIAAWMEGAMDFGIDMQKKLLRNH